MCSGYYYAYKKIITEFRNYLSLTLNPCNFPIEELEGRGLPMQYYYSFQYWFYHTDLYQNILSEMPDPFNNIYFDTVFLLGLVVYVIYRIIEMIRISCYHKRIRGKQANERQIRLERDQEM